MVVPINMRTLQERVWTLIIVFDILRGNKQHMWIMNVVWPLTTLYAGPLALWSYFKVGRLSTHHAMKQVKARGEKPEARKKPFWQSTALGTTHCGSGCTLGDIVIVLVPLTLFGKTVFAAWVIDYILAFLFGIAFQYFTIKPMKGLSPKKGLREALKADPCRSPRGRLACTGGWRLSSLG
jgi:hypothetical protein